MDCYICLKPAGTSQLMRCNCYVHLSCLKKYVVETRDLTCLSCKDHIQAIDLSEIKLSLKPGENDEIVEFLKKESLSVLCNDWSLSDWDESKLCN